MNLVNFLVPQEKHIILISLGLYKSKLIKGYLLHLGHSGEDDKSFNILNDYYNINFILYH